MVERACTIRVENKYLEGKAVMSSAKLYFVWPFPGLLSSFFSRNFGTSESANSNRRAKERFVNMPSAIIDIILTWAKTKILKEKTKWTLRILKVSTRVNSILLISDSLQWVLWTIIGWGFEIFRTIKVEVGVSSRNLSFFFLFAN